VQARGTAGELKARLGATRLTLGLPVAGRAPPRVVLDDVGVDVHLDGLRSCCTSRTAPGRWPRAPPGCTAQGLAAQTAE
jgi:hypothetical protein